MPPQLVAAIVIASTAVQVDESNQQAKLQRKAGKVKANLGAAERLTAKRKAFREARVRRAQIINQGAAEGSLGSSGDIGGLGSVQTQLGSITGAFNQGAEANATLAGVSKGLSKSAGKSGIASGIGSLATSLFAINNPTGNTGGVTTPEADLTGIG